jgi:receptor protein-tyrosine kinase
MRRIKWPLLGAISGRSGCGPARNNVIVVTSALPGEGKTFTALNLALSIVRDRELRVILVDADVERPGLTPALGLERSPGLNDVLEDTGSDVSSVTYQTDVEGLLVVPAGKWHAQAPEFFAGSRMPQIIQDLIRRVGNGIIVIDSPPMLATDEAQIVTRYAGQVLFVVKADETHQRAVCDAIALVDQSATISAVLNRVQYSGLSSYYGQYHYGYGYGGAGSDKQTGTRDGGAGA